MSKHRNIETGSREFQAVLLSCLSQFPEEKKAKVLELITPAFDWELFYQYAIKHRVFPMVYRNLSSLTPCPLPEEIARKLEQQYKKSVLTSLKQAGELARIFTFFNDGNLPVLAIKGPSLGLHLYGNVTSRASSGDLDILVDPLHLAEAEQLLEDAGYLKEYHGVTLTQKQNEMQLKYNHHHLFLHPNQIAVELHWRLHEHYSLQPFGELWDNHQEVILADCPIPIPESQDYLLYLMFHGSRHGYPQLKWLCDIAELLERDLINWPQFLGQAKHSNLLPIVGQTLLLLSKFFGFEIPIGVAATIDTPKSRRLVQMVMPFLISPLSGVTMPGGKYYFRFRYYSWIWQGNGNQSLGYRLSLFHPSPLEYTTVQIPDRYYFLYYILRPFLLIDRAFRRQS